jgi:hypothetical protein
MNIIGILIAVMFAMHVLFNHAFAQTNIEEEQNTQVTCQDLDKFYKIIDKLVEWQSGQMADEEYNYAQQVELSLVEELGCEKYMAGADFKLWSYDN